MSDASAPTSSGYQEARAAGAKAAGAIDSMLNPNTEFRPGALIDLAEVIINTVRSMALIGMSLFSLSIEAFLHIRFGERYITLLRCLLAYSAYQVCNSLWNGDLTRYRSFTPSNFISMALLAGVQLGMIGLFVCHGLYIHSRRRRGIRCHSRYAGDSHAFWSRLPFYHQCGGQATVQGFLEPAAVCLIGAIAGIFSATNCVTPWLMISGIALFLKGAIQRSILDGQVLDMIDRQIEAEVLQAAVSQWHEPGAVSTMGYVLPPALKAFTSEQRLAYAATTSRLDFKLRTLLAESEGAVAPPAETGVGAQDTGTTS